MKSVPNSDSEQCTESKLSRVHSAPTLSPSCGTLRTHCIQVAWTARAGRCVVAVLQHTPGCVAAHARPCRNARPAVLWLYRCAQARVGAPCSSVAAFAPGQDTIFLYRDSSPLPLAPCAVLRAHSAVLRAHAAVSQRCRLLYGDLKVTPPTIQFFLSRHSPPTARPSRARAALPVRRPTISHASWPCRGRAVAVLWHMLGRIVAEPWPCRGPCSCAQLPCVTIQSIVS